VLDKVAAGQLCGHDARIDTEASGPGIRDVDSCPRERIGVASRERNRVRIDAYHPVVGSTLEPTRQATTQTDGAAELNGLTLYKRVTGNGKRIAVWANTADNSCCI
jgi:hypothetical protein